MLRPPSSKKHATMLSSCVCPQTTLFAMTSKYRMANWAWLSVCGHAGSPKCKAWERCRSMVFICSQPYVGAGWGSASLAKNPSTASAIRWKASLKSKSKSKRSISSRLLRYATFHSFPLSMVLQCRLHWVVHPDRKIVKEISRSSMQQFVAICHVNHWFHATITKSHIHIYKIFCGDLGQHSFGMSHTTSYSICTFRKLGASGNVHCSQTISIKTSQTKLNKGVAGIFFVAINLQAPCLGHVIGLE